MANKKNKKPLELTNSEWSINLNSQSLHPMAQNLEFFFDFAQEIYVIVDTDGHIQRLNGRFAELLGWEPAEFIGKPFTKMVASSDISAVGNVLADVDPTVGVVEMVCQCVLATGRLLTIKWRISPQADGMLYLAGQPESDQPIGTAEADMATAAPTDQSQSLDPAASLVSEANALQVAQYQSLFNKFHEPLFLISDGKILECNEAALTLLDVTEKSELLDKQLLDFSPPLQANEQSSQELLNAQMAAMSLHNQVQFEWQMLTAAGAIHSLRMWLSRLNNDASFWLLHCTPQNEQADVSASLQRRIDELALLADIAAAIASVQDSQAFLDEIVELIKERFVLYHTQLFLLNDYGDVLRLQAAAGDDGKRLVQQGVQVGLTEHDNIISYAGMMQKPMQVSSIRESKQFRPIAILPQTRSEMALPIIVDEKLLGVLDLQCVTAERFSLDESRVYQSLAILIGVAMQNARHLAEAVRSRQELARLTRRSEEHKHTVSNAKIGTQTNYTFVDDELVDYGTANGDGRHRDMQQLQRSLSLQERELGALTIEAPQSEVEDATFIVDAVLESLTAHLQNLRLTEQTEEALGETELLYHISGRLNVASSLHEMFQAILESGLTQNIKSAGLLMVDVDDQGLPEYATVAADWQQTKVSESAPTLTVGQRLYLPDLPASGLWINSVDEIVVIDDVRNDWRVDAPTKNLFEQLQIGALALLPLSYRGRWLGVFRFAWTEPRIFESNERRVYQALTIQTSTAINNLMLLDESQLRAAQLEKLSQAETDLSLANDEDAILQALVRQLPSRWLRKGTLSYLDDSTATLLQQTVSSWTPEGFNIDELTTLDQIPVSQNSLAQLWLQYPGEVLNIADIETDYRVPSAIKVMAEEEKWSAVTILPLRSANRWQGLITLYWTDSYELTDDQFFLFDRLMEPVAAVVASRRAQLEQQQAEAAERVARRETESLYNASRNINEAATLESILAATVESAGVTDFTSGVIVIFDEDTSDGEVDLQVVANWYGGQGHPPDEVGMHHIIYSPSAAEFLMPDDIIFIESLQTDQRVPLQVRSNLLGRQRAEALLLLPLLASGRKLGAMMLTSETPHHFSERERRVFGSLTPQIAIAIQNRSLLEAAQNRARRERVLREITAQVRSSNSVDTILRIAAEQVGKAFKRPTYVALDESSEGSNEQSN